MRTYDLQQIVDSIIGSTHPTGDDYLDIIRKDNVKVLGELLIEKVRHLHQVAKFKDSDLASIAAIGKEADAILQEIKEIIDL